MDEVVTLDISVLVDEILVVNASDYYFVLQKIADLPIEALDEIHMELICRKYTRDGQRFRAELLGLVLRDLGASFQVPN